MAKLRLVSRRLVVSTAVVAACSLSIAWPLTEIACAESFSDDQVPTVEFRPARELNFPSATDCNSPAHWKGDTLYLFNSAGSPKRSSGPDLFHLGNLIDCPYDRPAAGSRWIECTLPIEDGALLGWYHLEPNGICPDLSAKRVAENEPALTSPRIGAVLSDDDGATWKDLGIVLEAPPNTDNCQTANKFFAGGHGDFSAILDANQEFVYFFFSSYYGKPAEQGVAVARMKYADRHAPVGKVWKWHEGGWKSPGIGGEVTPIFPAQTDWHQKNASAFWGAAVHWNTHLECYVMLLNRSKDWTWTQEGIYVTFSRDLAEPRDWTPPRRIVEEGNWYPQVIGLEKGGTDKLAGRVARFFMGGKSDSEIVFVRPDERLERN